MRYGHRLDEKLLKARFHRGLDFLHPAHQLLDLAPRSLVEQRDARTGSGGVTRRTDMVERTVRNHAQHHGVLHVDVAAEGAGEADPVDPLDAHALHQQPHARVQRGLAQLYRTHVVLRYLDRPRALACGTDLIRKCAAVALNARVARSQRAVDDAVVAYHACEIQLGQYLDDARAADAGYAGCGDRLFEALFVGPPVAADHLEARLQRLWVDAHALDRAGRGALTAADLRALESGAGGAGASEQALVVAQDNFGVGADVDQQRDLVGQVGSLGEQDARGVGADMAGDAWQHIDARVAVDRKVDLDRPQRERAVGRQRERRAAELDRIDTQQQVVHDRVADEGGFQDIGGRHADLLRHVGGEFVERVAHRGCHRVLAAGIHHHIRHPAHQVFAKTNLRVHHAGSGDHLAGRQVAKVRGNSGRSDVNRDAERVLSKTWPDRDDLAAAVHCHRHLPVALAQCLLQLLQHAHIALQVAQAPLEFERVFEPAQVARRVVHIGLLYLDEVQPDHRVEVNVVRLGGLSHHLTVHLAGRGHVDDHVALQQRRARQPTPGRQRLGGAVGLLDGAVAAEVVGVRAHAVLGKLALGHHHLAAPADAAPAADRVDVDAERSRRLQHWRSDRKAAAPARRGEDDQRVLACHGC